MYKKVTIFIICMIIGMAMSVVMDYFIQNATPFRWIVIIATSAWCQGPSKNVGFGSLKM